MLRFRVTHWPKFPLPVPPVRREWVELNPKFDEEWRKDRPWLDYELWEDYILEHEADYSERGYIWERSLHEAEDRPESVRLPDGFYYRELADLQLASSEAVCRFVSEYGPPLWDEDDERGRIMPLMIGGRVDVTGWSVDMVVGAIQSIREATEIWEKQDSDRLADLEWILNRGLEGHPAPRFACRKKTPPTADGRPLHRVLHTACQRHRRRCHLPTVRQRAVWAPFCKAAWQSRGRPVSESRRLVLLGPLCARSSTA